MGEQEAQRIVEQWNSMRPLDRRALGRQNEHYEVHLEFRAARLHAIGLMNDSEKATWGELHDQLRMPDYVDHQETHEYLRHAYNAAERAVLGELMKDKLFADNKPQYHGVLSGAWLEVQQRIRSREERERRKHPRL